MTTHSTRTTISVKARRVVLTATLALLATPTAAHAVPFGVGDDGALIAQPQLLDQAHDQLGAQWVRLMVRKGREHDYEPVIRHANKLGYRILVNLYPAGVNARDYPGWARWLAKRWPTVDAWSVGNEPELQHVPVCQYVRTYERTRREIRRTSSAPVLFGELSPHAWRWVELMRFCPRLKHRPDGVAVHPYQGSDPLSTRIGNPWEDRPRRWRDPVTHQPCCGDWIGIGRLKAFKRVLRRSGLSAPLWLTEFSWLSESTTDAQQAEWVPRAFEQARRVRARVLIWHGAWSDGPHRAWNSPVGPQAHRALSSRARAQSAKPAGEVTATDGLIYEAVRQADAFWRTKGLNPPANPHVTIYDDPDASVSARGQMPGNTVMFDRDFVRYVRKSIRARDRLERRNGYEQLFLVAAHERGHNLGLDHQPTGLMRGDAGDNTPGSGVLWAIAKAR